MDDKSGLTWELDFQTVLLTILVGTQVLIELILELARRKSILRSPSASQTYPTTTYPMTQQARYNTNYYKERMPALQALNDYYNSYVCIHEDEWEASRSFVENFKISILNYLAKNCRTLKVLKMEPAGSTAEGLKVIRPNEYDVELHLNMGKTSFEIIDCGEFEYVLIEFVHKTEADMFKNYASVHTFGKDYKVICLDPQKVRAHFQSMIQKAVNKKELIGHGVRHLKTGTIGPAITIWIDHTDLGELSIDLVPLIKLDEFELVAKPHPKLRNKSPISHFNHGTKTFSRYRLKEPHEFSKFWIRSFAQEERTYINTGFYGLPTNSCHKKCLQIIKAIKENHKPELGMFRSYTFKTIFLHMLRDLDKDDWEEDKLNERFMDFIKRLRGYLMVKKLPHFFVMELNMLRDLDSKTIYGTLCFLQKIISKDKYLNFLRKDA